MKWRFDAVVVSDLHLGARNSRVDDFLRFLDVVETERLILAGDIFDHPNLLGLEKKHMRVLSVLRDLSQFAQVIWLRGNHDPSESWFGGLLGIDPKDETVLDVNGKQYLVCHGHSHDKALGMPRPILGVADMIYKVSQQIDPSHRFARQLKRKCKRFTHSIEMVRRWASPRAGLVSSPV